jgi:hypothetical protein
MSESAQTRPRRRLPFGLLVLLAAVIAAAVYLRCGNGWGLGGMGGGGIAGSGSPAAPKRCALKVTATGIIVDGKPLARDAAVAACKSAGGAIVTVTGDAREGDWTELEQALEAAHVPFDRHGR